MHANVDAAMNERLQILVAYVWPMAIRMARLQVEVGSGCLHPPTEVDTAVTSS